MNEEDKRKCFCSYPKKQKHKTASGSSDQKFMCLYTLLSWPLSSTPRRSLIGYVCKENTFVTSLVTSLGIHVNVFTLESVGDERSFIFIFGIRIT